MEHQTSEQHITYHKRVSSARISARQWSNTLARERCERNARARDSFASEALADNRCERCASSLIVTYINIDQIGLDWARPDYTTNHNTRQHNKVVQRTGSPTFATTMRSPAYARQISMQIHMLQQTRSPVQYIVAGRHTHLLLSPRIYHAHLTIKVY